MGGEGGVGLSYVRVHPDSRAFVPIGIGGEAEALGVVEGVDVDEGGGA